MRKIFPEIEGHRYTGSRLAKWSLLPIFAFTLVRSLLHIFLPDGGAQSIATIPLSTFSLEAQGAVIQIFGLWGLSQLITVLFEILLFVYRDDFIPFIYIMLIVEYAGRLGLGRAKPMELSGIAPGAVGNYVLIPLFIVLFLLSIKKRRPASKVEIS